LQRAGVTGVHHEQQVALPLDYHGVALDCGYRIDLLVADLVIVEVKSVAKVLPIHRTQVMTSLKLLKLRLGLIINFNVSLCASVFIGACKTEARSVHGVLCGETVYPRRMLLNVSGKSGKLTAAQTISSILISALGRVRSTANAMASR
jgi:GxxExxY protein